MIYLKNKPQQSLLTKIGIRQHLLTNNSFSQICWIKCANNQIIMRIKNYFDRIYTFIISLIKIKRFIIYHIQHLYLQTMIFPKKILILPLLLICQISFISSQADFNQFINKMESKVKKLAEVMEQKYDSTCKDGECLIQSYFLCNGTDSKKCYDDFVKDQDCVAQGAYLSQSSAISFPNSINPSTLSQKEKAFVCSSAELEKTFNEIGENRNQQFTFQYIGSNFGAMRTYPPPYREVEENQCQNYDPRFRPWYTSASSGNKNVVLILDTSESMNVSGKLNTAKKAAQSVINTLSINDFIGIITFPVQTNITPQLSRGSQSQKLRIIGEVKKLEGSGVKDYGTAFTNAILFISKSFENQQGSKTLCDDPENIILFLTDGLPQNGANTSEDLITIIDQQKQDLEIILFSYAIGISNNQNIDLLKNLSCNYKGTIFTVSSTNSESQLITNLQSYYTYISAGLKQKPVKKPVWSEPYDDKFGLSKIITVSMPFYYQSDNIFKILGVAGVDVQIITFQNKFGKNESTIVQSLNDRSRGSCYMNKLTQCNIQTLRNQNFKCQRNSDLNCSQLNSSNCSVSASKIFQSVKETNRNYCCGLTTEGLAGVVIGSVAGAFFIFNMIYYIVWRHNNKVILNNKKLQNDDPPGENNPYISQQPNN